MATFRVGQRVRVRKDVAARQECEWALGMETSIIGRASLRGWDWMLGLVMPDGRHIEADSSALEPLDDPAVDAFIERIKKLGKEPINEVPKVEIAK